MEDIVPKIGPGICAGAGPLFSAPFGRPHVRRISGIFEESSAAKVATVPHLCLKLTLKFKGSCSIDLPEPFGRLTGTD